MYSNPIMLYLWSWKLNQFRSIIDDISLIKLWGIVEDVDDWTAKLINNVPFGHWPNDLLYTCVLELTCTKVGY